MTVAWGWWAQRTWLPAWPGKPDHGDRSNPLVATSMNCPDALWAIESSSRQAYRTSQNRRTHGLVTPQLLQELLSRDHTGPLANQVNDELEDPWLDSHGTILTGDCVSFWVDLDVQESIQHQSSSLTRGITRRLSRNMHSCGKAYLSGAPPLLRPHLTYVQPDISSESNLSDRLAGVNTRFVAIGQRW